MASDRPPEIAMTTSGKSPISVEKALSSRRAAPQLVNKAENHLQDSLTANEPVEKNYHTRLALQALQIASE